MKNRVLILSFSIFGFFGCSHQQSDKADLIYEIHEDKRGETIREGDYVALLSVEKTVEDSILYSSYENGRPVLLLREKSLFKGDFNTALGLLSEGDSATFKINVDSIKRIDSSKVINTSGKYLIYTVKIKKVIPRGDLTDRVFDSKIRAFHDAETEASRKNESFRIRSYIASHNLKPTTTKSGLNYVIRKEGSGSRPVSNDTVIIMYTARLLSGKIIDTSDSVLAKRNKIYSKSASYGAMKLVMVDKPVSGFQEALGLFPRGTKAELLIPSKLAYGGQGNHAVQPYNPLLCEIEIIDIISSE